jgi:hypothetical protein
MKGSLSVFYDDDAALEDLFLLLLILLLLLTLRNTLSSSSVFALKVLALFLGATSAECYKCNESNNNH